VQPFNLLTHHFVEKISKKEEGKEINQGTRRRSKRRILPNTYNSRKL
jgi:hypothetical protein